MYTSIYEMTRNVPCTSNIYMTIILLYFKQILIVELITYTALKLGSKHQKFGFKTSNFTQSLVTLITQYESIG